MMKLIKILKIAGCICTVVAIILLIAMAILGYNKYGLGLGYYIAIVFPLISMLVGIFFSAVKRHKYIKLSVAYMVVLIAVCMDQSGNMDGFVPVLLLYLAISILVCICFDGFWRLLISRRDSNGDAAKNNP